jgi:flagellar assembly factor FliW
MPQEINSSRFGSVTVADEDLLTLPRGLVGIPGSEYALLRPAGDGPFAWLQSRSDPGFALPVTDPNLFFPDYAVEVDAGQIAGLRDVDPDEVRVWVTVRAAASLHECTANLRAPILVARGVAVQVINTAADAPMRARLVPPAAVAA